MTALLYWPLRMYDFVNLDDSLYILSNYHITHGINWGAFRWCFQAGYAANWHPITWMSHMLDCRLYGFRAGGHHLVNVALHAANSVLLFVILKRLTKTFWRSAMVAALFAWHPLHVESVAWISERKDVLSTFFWLLAIGAYLKYSAKGGAGRYLLVLLLFALALMAKPMVVTLPFILLLLDWWPLGRFAALRRQAPPNAPGIPNRAGPWQFLVVEKVPFFLLAAGSCVLTMIAQYRGRAVESLEHAALFDRLVHIAVSYTWYLDKLIWPSHLTVIYPLQYPFSESQTAYAAVVLILVSLGVVASWERRPYLAVGWLWFLGTLAPVIGFVQVGGQAWADRYAYIPSMGFFIMVCWGAHDLTRHWRFHAPLLAAAAVIVLTACGFATRAQLQYWKNSGALFLRAIQVTPDNFIARCSYGAYLRDHNRLDQAREECETALRIAPRYAYGHNFLGGILMLQGKTNEALAHLQISLQIMPDQPGALLDLGKIRLAQQNPAAAAAAFSEAVQRAPYEPAAHALLGHALALQGQFAPAQAEFAEALRLEPRFADAEYQLALALSMEHKPSEAAAHYKAALRSQPDFPDALNNLAWILAANARPELRDGPQAVDLAARACALTQDTQPKMIGTLAAAYAEAGRFAEAAASAQKARDVALAQGDKNLAARNAELLKLYRAHQPFHEK